MIFSEAQEARIKELIQEALDAKEEEESESDWIRRFWDEWRR